MNKLTQPQLRIITSTILSKAHRACEEAEEIYNQNVKHNKALRDKTIAKVFAKHKKQALVSLKPYVNWSNVSIEVAADVQQAFQRDVATALREIEKDYIGSEKYVEVAFPALGLDFDVRRGRRHQDKSVKVPASQADKWRDLSKQIDRSFLEGSALDLIALIEAL